MDDPAGHSFETVLATTLTPVAQRYGFRVASSRLLGGVALLVGLLATARASAAWHKHHKKHAKHAHANAQKKDDKSAKHDKDQSADNKHDKDQSADGPGQNDDSDTGDASAPKPPADDAGASSTDETASGEKPLKFKVRWSGLETDFRAALASATGGVDSKTKLDSGLVLPLWVDVGYRFDKRWFAGIFGQVGFTLQGRKCGLASSCHPTDYRFGAEGQFHILPAHALDPWFGLGVGYELYDVQGVVARGFELANVQAGLLFRTSRRSGLGPFVAVTTGRFSHIFGIPISDQASHEWFMVGLHGSYWQPLYN